MYNILVSLNENTEDKIIAGVYDKDGYLIVGLPMITKPEDKNNYTTNWKNRMGRHYKVEAQHRLKVDYLQLVINIVDNVSCDIKRDWYFSNKTYEENQAKVHALKAQLI